MCLPWADVVDVTPKQENQFSTIALPCHTCWHVIFGSVIFLMLSVMFNCAHTNIYHYKHIQAYKKYDRKFITWYFCVSGQAIMKQHK